MTVKDNIKLIQNIERLESIKLDFNNEYILEKVVNLKKEISVIIF